MVSFFLVIPFEWWMSRRRYARLNDYVMGVIYSPFLVIAAIFEMRSARGVKFNRTHGELDDDILEEWEEMIDMVDFEHEGWTEKVLSAKSNVEDDQATLEVRELREEVKELKDMLKTLLEDSKGKSRED